MFMVATRRLSYFRTYPRPEPVEISHFSPVHGNCVLMAQTVLGIRTIRVGRPTGESSESRRGAPSSCLDLPWRGGKGQSAIHFEYLDDGVVVVLGHLG